MAVPMQHRWSVFGSPSVAMSLGNGLVSICVYLVWGLLGHAKDTDANVGLLARKVSSP